MTRSTAAGVAQQVAEVVGVERGERRAGELREGAGIRNSDTRAEKVMFLATAIRWAADRLTAVNQSGQQRSYGYDGLGRLT